MRGRRHAGAVTQRGRAIVFTGEAAWHAVWPDVGSADDRVPVGAGRAARPRRRAALPAFARSDRNARGAHAPTEARADAGGLGTVVVNRTPDDARRLLAAYDDCMAVEGAAREARIAHHEREDPGIAARLRAMLAVDAGTASTDAFGVESVVGELVAAASAADVDGPRQAGPFTLLRLLGRGGMGEVWLAERHHEGFRQEVALKLLKRGMDSEDLLRRFVQERRILAGLSHPGIARFIDGGVGETGAPWYAMEYVEGVPLTVHARQQGLDVRARVELVASVAEAVSYAQNRLVVHRDLKPSNILVDAQGRVRLLDFGIAKLLDEAPDAGATATGVRAMSPAYAAPEQILDEPVSAATDVYALGLVLYELLTGVLPHERGNATLGTLAERVRGETPDRPSARLRRGEATTTTTLGGDTNTAQRFARAVAGELDTIVLTALRREPERRYANAAAFADDLRRWLEGRPVAAQADTARYRMRKFVSRHRLAVGSASAVLLALMAGFGTALWQASVARGEAARANAAVAEALNANREVSRVLAFLSERLQESSPTEAVAGRKLTMVDWITSSLAKIDSELADAPVARSALRHTFGASLRELGEPDAALVVLQRALAESVELDPVSVDTAVTRHAIGATLHRLDRMTEARAEITAAIALLDAKEPTERVRLARLRALTTLLRIAAAEGRTEEMLAIAERNVAERAALWGPDDPRLAVDYNNLSQALSRSGRIADAERATRRSRDLLIASGSAAPARLAIVEQTVCWLASQRGAWPEAIDACRRADAYCVDALGPAHPSCLAVRATMAGAQWHAGEADNVRRLYPDLRRSILASTGSAMKVEVLRLGILLAAYDQDWTRLAEEASALREAMPTVSDPTRLNGWQFANAFAALANWRASAAPPARAAVLEAAERLLDDQDSAGLATAPGALAAYLALDRPGDAQAASEWRARGIAQLARSMPAAEAEQVWRRWLPRDVRD